MSSAIPNTFDIPLTIHISSSGTCIWLGLFWMIVLCICMCQMDKKNVLFDELSSSFILWKPAFASISVIYFMPAGLSRMSFKVRPLCTGLISTLLNLARSRYSLILSFTLGTIMKLLHHPEVFSMPMGTIICWPCNLSSSSFTTGNTLSCSTYATLHWGLLILIHLAAILLL